MYLIPGDTILITDIGSENISHPVSSLVCIITAVLHGGGSVVVPIFLGLDMLDKFI